MYGVSKNERNMVNKKLQQGETDREEGRGLNSDFIIEEEEASGCLSSFGCHRLVPEGCRTPVHRPRSKRAATCWRQLYACKVIY